MSATAPPQATGAENDTTPRTTQDGPAEWSHFPEIQSFQEIGHGEGHDYGQDCPAPTCSAQLAAKVISSLGSALPLAAEGRPLEVLESAPAMVHTPTYCVPSVPESRSPRSASRQSTVSPRDSPRTRTSTSCTTLTVPGQCSLTRRSTLSCVCPCCITSPTTWPRSGVTPNHARWWCFCKLAGSNPVRPCAATPTASRLISYYLWRLTQGHWLHGFADHLRRLRGILDETKIADMVEYHVVRDGVDEKRSKPCFRHTTTGDRGTLLVDPGVAVPVLG